MNNESTGFFKALLLFLARSVGRTGIKRKAIYLEGNDILTPIYTSKKLKALKVPPPFIYFQPQAISSGEGWPGNGGRSARCQNTENKYKTC
jgi:hypothetical protein